MLAARLKPTIPRSAGGGRRHVPLVAAAEGRALAGVGVRGSLQLALSIPRVS